MMALGIATGRLALYVPYWTMLVAAAILYGLAFIISSFTTAVWQLYLSYGVIGGISCSLSFVPAVSSMQQWFKKRRGITSNTATVRWLILKGLATGIGVSGSGIGNLTIPYILAPIIENYGWRTTMRIWAGIGFVLLLVAAALVKKRAPARSSSIPVKTLFTTWNFNIICASSFVGSIGYLMPFSMCFICLC
jgi:MFS family permease